jgi:hypothetical protein
MSAPVIVVVLYMLACILIRHCLWLNLHDDRYVAGILVASLAGALHCPCAHAYLSMMHTLLSMQDTNVYGVALHSRQRWSW